MPNGGTRPLLGDVASVKLGKTAGEIDRYNMQRVVSFTANVEGVPLGEASKAIRAAVQRAGTPPRGVTVNLRGQIPPLEATLSGLRLGLALSIGAIFLLLAAAFQSFRLSLGIVLMLPAVLLGVAVALLLTNTTLNVQSFTGAIMAMGIAVANAILLVSFAERTRVATGNAVEAAATGARDRLRAVLMTATAMIAGMIPIALGAEQTAPLGRAVIGGLVAATFATLLVLPDSMQFCNRGPGRVAFRLILQIRKAGGMKLVSAVAVLAACNAFAQVETVKVTSQAVERSVKLTGDLAPFQAVDIYARVTGYLEKISVDRGSAVQKGQVIAELSAPEMQAQVAEAVSKVEIIESQRAEAEAKLASAQSTYDRMNAASATAGAIAGNELITAEKAVAAARAVVAALESSNVPLPRLWNPYGRT